MRSAFVASGIQARTKGISQRAQNTIVSPIKEMALLADAVSGAVSIGWGLPSFQTPKHILEAVKVALDQDGDIGKYPNIKGIIELRRAISERFEKRYNVQIDPDTEVIVTVGAQQALISALLTIVDPGDEVILISPVFSSYIDQIVFAGGVPVYVNLVEKDAWRLDVERISDAITSKTKAIILNYPLNPTGTVFKESELRHMAELAIKHDFFIITDETYNFLIYEEIKLFNLFSLPPIRERLIGCYSFSKEYAMTGWRVGYLCAEPGVIQEIQKFHDASVITAPRVSQVAAFAALQGPQDCVDYFRKELEIRRTLMSGYLDELSDLFDYCGPAGAYYTFAKIKLPHIDSLELALRLLHEAKVVTIPGNAFGPGGESHLRLCFAVSKENIQMAFDRVSQWWEKNKTFYR